MSDERSEINLNVDGGAVAAATTDARQAGSATDRERHVTERAQAIARAYQSVALSRGLQTASLDEIAAVVRDLIDVGMIR